MNETNRQWLLAKRPHGMVTKDNFDYVESKTPDVGEGEVLVRNLYFSFDPTQRGWMEDRPSYLPPVAIGEPMRASSVGQIVASNSADYAVGDLVQTAHAVKCPQTKNLTSFQLVGSVLSDFCGNENVTTAVFFDFASIGETEVVATDHHVVGHCFRDQCLTCCGRLFFVGIKAQLPIQIG